MERNTLFSMLSAGEEFIHNTFHILTSKNPAVDWPLTHPYLMADCLSRSSTLLIADSFLLDVRNAVQLAVYDWVTINAKNHHMDAHTLVEKALQEYVQRTAHNERMPDGYC